MIPVYWTRAANVTWGCNNKDGGQSEACLNCYAADQHRRFEKMRTCPEVYHHPFNEIQLRPKVLNEMRKGVGEVIFVCNMSDLFHAQVPFDYIDRVFSTMAQYPEHTYLVLTKRARRMRGFVYWHLDKWRIKPVEFAEKYSHVWMGVTVENQQRADERIPHLLKTPAAHRWISAEPLLGPIDLTKCIRPTIYDYEEVLAILDANGECEPEEFIPLNELTGDYVNDGPELVRNPAWSEHRDWVEWRARTIALKRMLDLVIVGGESSRNGHVRTMNPEWARSIKDQCTMAGVKFYFKQYGTGYCKENNMVDNQVFFDVDYSRLKPRDIWS